MIEPVMRGRVWLRCYNSASCSHTKQGYHNAMSQIEDCALQPSDRYGCVEPVNGFNHSPDDPRWPTHCACGYEFKLTDRQYHYRSLYRRTDNGEECTLSDAPVGAMWFAPWMSDVFKGPDGNALYVMTPGGEWLIDGRASNCTMPDDWTHRCWCRHGEAPNITVDKNGHTCAAGAGSIIAGSYHGFLQNGYLTCCP